jgi:phage tail sheath protein FI
MSIQQSPGINLAEIDLTTVVPSVATTTGAIAGVFAWGPANEPILISSEVELVRRFGKPVTGFNIETFYTASDFLAYGNALYVSRTNDGLVAAPSVGSVSAQAGFTAKYKGVYGNALALHVATGNTYSSANNILKNVVYGAPSSANNAHIVVVDTSGVFASTPGSVLEIFEDVSLVSGAKKSDGTNNFWADVINNTSNYISVSNANSAPFASTLIDNVPFVSGSNSVTEANVSIASLTTAYDVYGNPDEIDVSLIMQGRPTGLNGNAELANVLIGLCENRKDAIVFVSPKLDDDTAAEIVSFANNVVSSSYAVLDSGYKYRYDKYNDVYVYTPLNGDIAGLCARTDDIRDPWFSPAGYNRGIIKNIIKLRYNPNKADRDTLYKASVNPVVTQPGQGTLLFGDKTGLKRPSAFDRINVRRLFIVLEKAIARAAKTTLFEFNDEFTRRYPRPTGYIRLPSSV